MVKEIKYPKAERRDIRIFGNKHDERIAYLCSQIEEVFERTLHYTEDIVDAGRTIDQHDREKKIQVLEILHNHSRWAIEAINKEGFDFYLTEFGKEVAEHENDDYIK